jgi:hypothetical protein
VSREHAGLAAALELRDVVPAVSRVVVERDLEAVALADARVTR